MSSAVRAVATAACAASAVVVTARCEAQADEPVLDSAPLALFDEPIVNVRCVALQSLKHMEQHDT